MSIFELTAARILISFRKPAKRHQHAVPPPPQQWCRNYCLPETNAVPAKIAPNSSMYFFIEPFGFVWNFFQSGARQTAGCNWILLMERDKFRTYENFNAHPKLRARYPTSQSKSFSTDVSAIVFLLPHIVHAVPVNLFVRKLKRTIVRATSDSKNVTKTRGNFHNELIGSRLERKERNRIFKTTWNKRKWLELFWREKFFWWAIINVDRRNPIL